LKDTVPERVVEPGELTDTCAVSVTFCPLTDGFAEDPSAVVDDALLTTCDTAGVDVLPASVVLPPYVAVSDRVPPAAWKLVTQVADPVVVSTATASQPLIVVEPSLKATVPDRDVEPGAVTATFAVSVTL
jgi:hypothetical protein